MLPLESLSPTAAAVSAPVPFAIALLALGGVRGLGVKGLRALVREYREQLGRLWDLPADALRQELARVKVPTAAKVADELGDHRPRLLEAAQAKAAGLAERGVHVLGPSTVPPRLAALSDGPLWLFVEGDPQALFVGPHIAVVGTRNATKEGVRATDAAVRSLAAYPITVVSGLANGIDAVAHAAALRDGVRNVAFLGHGTDLVFPAETAEMRARIVHAGGAIASEYMPGEHYRKAQFVQRNRLQAALADVVVAVEGERRGGTAHTVRFASAYGRPIVGFTWPGAGDLTVLIEAEPAGQLIDIFSLTGRRAFDGLCRRLADSYGHVTFGLTLVERQLIREVQLRALPREDLARLRRRIDALLDER
ncbi:DNA-processing protein DprA [Microbispora sp. H13382]|uniref:DNA-processing protein DprA n=1 Tax=Microbispora sp. H13382 TaxID=2729112 RepID=UPI0016005D38|nr:DNA-processing protein DprA [Microbispora sp. H13382]